MAEQHRVDVARAEREVAVAAEAFRTPALEQPAVQQQRLTASVHPVHRPGDRPGRPQNVTVGSPSGLRLLAIQLLYLQTTSGDPMPLPRVLADLPVSAVVIDVLQGRVELVPWDATGRIEAIYTYGHPTVNGAMLDRLPDVRVISNFGVGVDHIDVAAAQARAFQSATRGRSHRRDRGPGVCLAAGGWAPPGRGRPLCARAKLSALRSVVHAWPRGPWRHAWDHRHGPHRRAGSPAGPRFRYDRALLQSAAQARAEAELPARHVSQDELLTMSDFVVLTVPLMPETHGLIGRAQLARMKPTAILVNVARGRSSTPMR